MIYIIKGIDFTNKNYYLDGWTLASWVSTPYYFLLKQYNSLQEAEEQIQILYNKIKDYTTNGLYYFHIIPLNVAQAQWNSEQG